MRCLNEALLNVINSNAFIIFLYAESLLFDFKDCIKSEYSHLLKVKFLKMKEYSRFSEKLCISSEV